MTTNPHTQIGVQIPARTVGVDAGLAELLEVLWARGIFTLASCEAREFDGRAYIQFEDPGGAATFVCCATGLKWAEAVRPLASLLSDPHACGSVLVLGAEGWSYSKTYYRYSVEFPAVELAGLAQKVRDFTEV